MISLSECKKILNKGGNKYSDSDVEKIRALLIRFAEIELEQYKSMAYKVRNNSIVDKNLNNENKY